jgi:hypothetical protein
VGSRSAAHSLPAKCNRAKPVGCPVAVQRDDDDEDDNDDDGDDDDDESRRGDFNCLSRHNTSGAYNSKHENAALAVFLICKQVV